MTKAKNIVIKLARLDKNPEQITHKVMIVVKLFIRKRRTQMVCIKPYDLYRVLNVKSVIETETLRD